MTTGFFGTNLPQKLGENLPKASQTFHRPTINTVLHGFDSSMKVQCPLKMIPGQIVNYCANKTIIVSAIGQIILKVVQMRDQEADSPFAIDFCF
jgi:hypothetical protein